MWDMRRAPADMRIHVSVPLGRRPRPAPATDVVVHRSACLPACDLVQRADGIVVTSPPRTLFDMAALVDRLSLESMIEQAIERRMCSIPTLLGVADRLARPGRAGSGRFVAVLASRPAWRKPVDSHDELVLEQALVRAGLPRPVRQHPVRLRTGRRVHPDLAWPDLRFAVEVDHRTWHASGAAVAYDKHRDRQLRLVGWSVERVTDDDVRERLATTADEIRQLYADRALALRAA
jgi:very-short-patch-repair endonuclease